MKRNTLLEIKEKTQDILNVISNARKEVSEALGRELLDMNFLQIFYDSIPAPEDRIPRQPEIAKISTMGIAPG